MTNPTTPERPSIVLAVTDSLRGISTTPADGATVRLALEYATEIDQSTDRGYALEKYGPKLLAVLEALKATPRSRMPIKQASNGRLDKYRNKNDGARR